MRNEVVDVTLSKRTYIRKVYFNNHLVLLPGFFFSLPSSIFFLRLQHNPCWHTKYYLSVLNGWHWDNKSLWANTICQPAPAKPNIWRKTHKLKFSKALTPCELCSEYQPSVDPLRWKQYRYRETMHECGRWPRVQSNRLAHPGTLLGKRPWCRRPPDLGGPHNKMKTPRF